MNGFRINLRSFRLPEVYCNKRKYPTIEKDIPLDELYEEMASCLSGIHEAPPKKIVVLVK